MKTHATFGRSVSRACDQCRRRKSRCDGVFPCYPCIIRDLNHVCSYSKPQRTLSGHNLSPSDGVISRRYSSAIYDHQLTDIGDLTAEQYSSEHCAILGQSRIAKVDDVGFFVPVITGIPTPISPMCKLRMPSHDNVIGDILPWPLTEMYICRILPFAPVLSLRALYSRSNASYEQCLISTLWAFLAVYASPPDHEVARALARDALDQCTEVAAGGHSSSVPHGTGNSSASLDVIRALTLLSHLHYGLGQTRQSRAASVKAFELTSNLTDFSESSFDTIYEKDLLVSITVSTLAISGASIVLNIDLPEVKHLTADYSLDPVFWFQVSATLFHQSQVCNDENTLAGISQLLDAHLQNINRLEAVTPNTSDLCMILHHKTFVLACQCLTINALIKLYERLLDATLRNRRRTDGPVSTDLTPVLPFQTQTTTTPLTYLQGCKQSVVRLHILLAECDPATASAMTPIGIQAATIPGYAALRLSKESDIMMPDFTGLIKVFRGYANYWPAAQVACDDFLARVTETTFLVSERDE